MGTLNIMMTKLNAAPIARKGACLTFNVFLTLFEAAIHIGIITAPNTPQVAGLKYPSGMCMALASSLVSRLFYGYPETTKAGLEEQITIFSAYPRHKMPFFHHNHKQNKQLWHIKLLIPVSCAEPASLNVRSMLFQLETTPISSMKRSVLTVSAIMMLRHASQYARQRALSKLDIKPVQFSPRGVEN
jgi:hypothetical protein